MRQRATILTIIEAALAGNQQKARVYTELLIQRIRDQENVPEDERTRDIRSLQNLLDGKSSPLTYLVPLSGDPPLVDTSTLITVEWVCPLCQRTCSRSERWHGQNTGLLVGVPHAGPDGRDCLGNAEVEIDFTGFKVHAILKGP